MRTRILLGTFLIAFCSTLLYLDRFVEPWCPGFLILCLVATFFAGKELLALLDPNAEIPKHYTLFCLLLIISGNWLPHTGWIPQFLQLDSWKMVGILFTFSSLGAWLVEMARFQNPGQCSKRIASSVMVFFYLGILPSFLIQLRWVKSAEGGYLPGLLALGVTIAVTKGADIGAYFTGRMFGKTRMAPVLSPKKTWEGLAGGLALSSLIGLLWVKFLPHTPLCCQEAAILFGLCTGFAGVLGDLGESLLKRDAAIKDASNTVPEFGGLLDILDSLLFAGPIAWLFFLCS